jgi:hypothetical protein
MEYQLIEGATGADTDGSPTALPPKANVIAQNTDKKVFLLKLGQSLMRGIPQIGALGS